MIRAAFFDVDGTLMSHKTKQVPPSAREAVKKLRAAGIQCIVATGRHIGEMEKLPMEGMEFDGYLTLNGQLCLDGSRQLRWGVPIEGRMRQNLLALFRNHRLPILLVEEKQLSLNYVNPLVELVHQWISTAVPALREPTGGPIYQASVYLHDEELPILEEALPECVITRWSKGGVDVLAPGGGKMAGIRRYLREQGIAPEEIIAFGDGENDMGMLKLAGIGVAMGNAVPAVKAAADYVTADIDDDGIAKALRHFGLIE